MGNDNKKRSYLFYIAIPVALTLYFSLLVLDRWAVSTPLNLHLENKIEGFNKKENINNIIIGGSNAFYSLSAKFLSVNTNDTWYNLSISAEGFSDQNYIELLNQDLDFKKRQNVKNIFYSSIYYYRNGEIGLRNSSKRQIDGSNRFSIKPRFSGFTYLKRFLLNRKIFIDYPSQNEAGDIIFRSGLCDNERIFQRFKIEDFDKIYTNILYKAEALHSIFPNSTIYIIFPKDYIEEGSLGFYHKQISELKLFFKERSMIDNNTELFSSIKIFFQEPYSFEELCDSPSHANPVGRETRSEELLSWFNISTKSSSVQESE